MIIICSELFMVLVAKIYIPVGLKLTFSIWIVFPSCVFFILLCSEYFCRHCRTDLMVCHNIYLLFFLLKTQWNLNPLPLLLYFFTSSIVGLLCGSVTISCVCSKNHQEAVMQFTVSAGVVPILISVSENASDITEPACARIRYHVIYLPLNSTQLLSSWLSVM